jgi:hypothetical protein
MMTLLEACEEASHSMFLGLVSAKGCRLEVRWVTIRPTCTVQL